MDIPNTKRHETYCRLLLAHRKHLKADGLNNTTDIVASIAILVGLRIAQKPPDEDHHYGHMRAETVASLVAAFIMAFVGFQILVNATKINH